MISKPRGVIRFFALVSVLLSGVVLTLTAGPAQASVTPRGIHLAASTAPAAGLGIRLLDYPADQAGDSRSHEYIVQTVTGGATLTRHLRITNTTGSTQTVHLATTAASISSGAFKFTESGQNQLSKWTSVNTPTVVLPNGKSTTVTVTIAVPTTATVGEQYAVIWAAMRAPAQKNGSVSVVNRVGIREYINVNTQSEHPEHRPDVHHHPSHERTGQQTHPHGDGERHQYRIHRHRSHRTGHARARPRLHERRTIPDNAGLTLAPGQHGRVVIRTAAAVATGPWTATVTVHSGSLSHTKTARIMFPHQANMSTESNAGTAIWSIIAGILVLLILIAAGVIIAIRRRRRNARP